MKVAMLAPAGRGGIHHYAWLLCGALHERGVQADLVATSPIEQLPADGPKRLVPLPAGVGPRGYTRRCEVVRRAAAGYDVLHMQSPLWSLADPWLLLPAVRRAGVPAVTATVHNVLPHRRRRYHPRAYARLYDRLDGVAVHAAEHASALERCPAHVVLTPFGDHGPALPPPDPSGGPRALLELPDETAVVLFFGQIRPNKGLGDLIEALADTADRVALVVAGEPLEPLDGYVRAAARLGVNLALDESLLGYLDGARAASCIAGSDVMVLPYRSGWNSGVLSLCAHYRRPTVVTTVAAAPEDLARVPSGGVCPPRDPAALRTAIERALRGELAAPEMFPGWGAVAEAHLELWKRVLGVR